MLDGGLLAYSSMAISPFTGLFLVAIYNQAGLVELLAWNPAAPS